MKVTLLSLDRDEVTGMIFVDFKKAFDVVNYQLSLANLRLYRASDTTLSLFTSYLTERKQFVTINGQRSDPLLLNKVYRMILCWDVFCSFFVNDTI